MDQTQQIFARIGDGQIADHLALRRALTSFPSLLPCRPAATSVASISLNLLTSSTNRTIGANAGQFMTAQLAAQRFQCATATPDIWGPPRFAHSCSPAFIQFIIEQTPPQAVSGQHLLTEDHHFFLTRLPTFHYRFPLRRSFPTKAASCSSIWRMTSSPRLLETSDTTLAAVQDKAAAA